MEIIPIGFESFGVRSQATFIQTKDILIIIDPSAALAPRRYGLPPHIIEVKQLLKTFERIEELVRDAEYIIITHYHYDHHDPARFLDPSIYKGRIFLIKDFNSNINYSQKRRAYRFLSIVKEFAKDVKVVDGASLNIGSTFIKFSTPLPHGRDARLGYVLSICISDSDRVMLYSSDIEGGASSEHFKLLEFCNPNIAIIDGPPSYLLNHAFTEDDMKKAINFLNKFIERNREALETLVLDHHVFRDLNYTSFVSLLKPLYRLRIVSAAEFAGREPKPLEALRRALYKMENRDGLDLLKSSVRLAQYDELEED